MSRNKIKITYSVNYYTGTVEAILEYNYLPIFYYMNNDQTCYCNQVRYEANNWNALAIKVDNAIEEAIKRHTHLMCLQSKQPKDRHIKI